MVSFLVGLYSDAQGMPKRVLLGRVEGKEEKIICFNNNLHCMAYLMHLTRVHYLYVTSIEIKVDETGLYTIKYKERDRYRKWCTMKMSSVSKGE